jgi:hypothetical protein
VLFEIENIAYKLQSSNLNASFLSTKKKRVTSDPSSPPTAWAQPTQAARTLRWGHS